MFYTILLILVALIAYGTMIYNRLIQQIEAVKNNAKQIDIQLDRRFKVFESLIDIAKKYMDYEKSTLKEVVALRSQANAAHASGDEAARFSAENKISGIASGINVVFERYPELKANENCMQLQEEVVSTENKLAFAKQSYNDSIEIYNACKQSVPENFVVAMFKAKLDIEFTYWQLSSDQVKKNEEYTVKM